MENITLEKVDMVRERTNVSYAKAKEALEVCDGDILNALIYLEKIQGTSKNELFEKSLDDESFEEEAKHTISIEELKLWLKELIAKGNITRIKIKKDDTELIDIPVNAGIAAGVVAIVIPPILAAGVIAAIATQITIEITKKDGSVEVVNKYVSKVANDFKDKANDFKDKVKSKVNDVKCETKINKDKSNTNYSNDEETIYSYKVSFDDENLKKDNNNSEM